MLSVGKMAVGQQSYYLRLAAGVEDYYTGRGEAPGRWLGRGSPLLGLDGDVDREDLTAVLEGRPPGDDMQRLTRARLPGLDFTFRAPKSVSLLYALGEPAVPGEVVAAHEAAVDAAVGYLEREVCLSRRRTDGVQHQVPGEGFVAAGFRHQTSRAGDPTLHTHVLIANMTRMGDRRWGALHSRPMYRHAKTAGFLYQAQLRAELTRRLGVEWLPVVNGCADITGIPRHVVEVFSQRRAEILDLMEARAEHSARAAQSAALDSRRAKDYDVDPATLRADWAQRATAAGFGPPEIAGLLDRGVEREPLGWPPEMLFDTLASPDGVTEHASTFGRRDLVREIAGRMPEGADITLIEDLADEFLTDRRLVAVGEVAGEVRWTTVELLATEQRILDRAHHLRHTGAGIASSETVEAVLAGRPSISPEQAAMVRHLTTSGAGIDPVVGAAGTGKTYTLDAARHAWEASGHMVVGAALSARAAAELSAGSGIESMTVTRLLHQLRTNQIRLDHTSVVVIDESGMVGTRTLDALSARTAAAGAKLVLVGDTAQLPEIDAGGTFRALTEQTPPVQLVENRRQIHPWEIAALDHLRHQRTPDAVNAYATHDRIVTAETGDDLRQRLVEDWFDAPGTNNIMIASRRVDVADLNHRARTLLEAAGRLGHPDPSLDIRLRVGTREFAVGDQVMAVDRNQWDLDIVNGDIGLITRIDPKDRSITFLVERVGAERTMPADRLALGLLDHGYARTTYKTQGATVDRAFILAGDGDLDRQAGYTALSRGRLENRLYIPTAHNDLADALAPSEQPTSEPDNERRRALLEHAVRELSRDRSRHLASELLAALPAPEGHPVTDDAAGLLERLPAPVGPAATGTLAADLLASLPDPDDVEPDLTDAAAARVRARLDQLQKRPPAVDDDFGIGL